MDDTSKCSEADSSTHNNPFDVDPSTIVDDPEPWIDSLLDWTEEGGFYQLETDDALDMFAAIRNESGAIWKRIRRRVRARCKSCSTLPNVSEVDDWHQEVEAHAEQQARPGDVPVFDNPDDVNLSRALQAKLERRGGPGIVYARGEFWQYNPDRGIWSILPRGEVSETAQEFSDAIDRSGREPRPLSLSERKIRGSIRLLRDRVDESSTDRDGPDFFDQGQQGLTFANDLFLGVDFDAGELVAEPPTPEHRATVGVNVPLEAPPPPAPTFESYLDDIFDGDPNAEQKRELLLEFAGACLLGIAPKKKRALVLYDNTDAGEGDNGKSVWLHILSEILPRHATSEVPPQQFNARFKAAELAGSRFNYASELPENDVLESAKLKEVVSGDRQTVERKQEDPFSFRPEAGHIFAANEFPRVVATDDAFWRRWLVLPFNNTFTPVDEPGRDADPMLAEKVLSNEKAGVVARCIQGAKRLLEQGHYTTPPEVRHAKRQWRADSSSVEQFLIDECENYGIEGPIYDSDAHETWHRNSEHHVSARSLYEAYREWAAATGHRQMTNTKFGKRLKKVIEHRKAASGRAYRVRLKPLSERIGGEDQPSNRGAM